MKKMDKLKSQLISNNFKYVTKSNEIYVELGNVLITIWYEDSEFYMHVFDKQDISSFILDDPKECYYKKKVKSVIEVLDELVASW